MGIKRVQKQCNDSLFKKKEFHQKALNKGEKVAEDFVEEYKGHDIKRLESSAGTSYNVYKGDEVIAENQKSVEACRKLIDKTKIGDASAQEIEKETENRRVWLAKEIAKWIFSPPTADEDFGDRLDAAEGYIAVNTDFRQFPDFDKESEGQKVVEDFMIQNFDIWDVINLAEYLEDEFADASFKYRKGAVKTEDARHGYYVVLYTDAEGWSPAEGGSTFLEGRRYRQKWGPYATKEQAMKEMERIANKDAEDENGEVRMWPEDSMAIVVYEGRYSNYYAYYHVERDDRWGSKQTGGGGWDWSAEKDPVKHPTKKAKDSSYDYVVKGEDPVELAMEAEGEPEEEEIPLRVCEHCLRGIESKEGKQFVKPIYFDNADGVCDWCEDGGFDTLYEITSEAETIHDAEPGEGYQSISMSVEEVKSGHEIYATATYDYNSAGREAAINELAEWFEKNPDHAERLMNGELTVKEYPEF